MTLKKMTGVISRVENSGLISIPPLCAFDGRFVWSSAFRRLGAFTTLCRLKAELQTGQFSDTR